MADARNETEVSERKRRRYLTTGYKLKILEKIEKCKRQGEVGEILRQEGLYQSQISQWKKQNKNGELRNKKRGPDSKNYRLEIAKLKRKEARLREELRQNKVIIEIQKKVLELMKKEDELAEENKAY